MTEPRLAATSLNRATPQPQPVPNLIAIASGKGGVGKTWLSVTLTHAIARSGKRALLFDGDLGLANVDVQLGLMADRDLAEVVGGRVTLRGAIQSFPEGGFDIVAGRSGAGGLATLAPQQLALLSEQLAIVAGGYDRVVIDLGAGIDRTVRQLAGSCGRILAVTTDEPTSLTDAYAFIKVMHGAGRTEGVGVVVNLATNEAEGEKTYEALRKACASFLKFEPPLIGIVRRDPKVKEAIRNQTPLLVRSPTCQAAEDVERIAERLLRH